MKDTYLILGASSDLGLALLEALPREAIILAHSHKSPLPNKPNLHPLKADLSSLQEVQALIENIKANHPTPNKIVHLAHPKYAYTRLKDISPQALQHDFSASVQSFFLMLQAFLPPLAHQKQGGKVVAMLSSSVCNIPPKHTSVYTTMKYALLGLMRSMASDYKEHNIQINCLSPSMIETKFLESIDPKIVQVAAENHPLKRNATPKDIVPMLLFLLSSGSDYMTGLNIPITGGLGF
ncbi:(S)-acetoin forming diacetyl reductase [Helicobacter sp. NHP21005]|uniref:SDR family NAD(P)-dependent oxidoreductase n=1 Tax=Helicobacter felistomachi TaxID=3040201 RepID=UPI002572D68B|nr:SDR family oxidoreductase [Helicobacter sp. NHP21005]BEG56981.1 (S)-acetoin forming diacetyl reductase [Helicobacter sp. NHP21005]